MKKTLTIIGLAMATLAGVNAQTSFTGNSSTGHWFTNRWNNSADAAPFTSAFTANNTASFTAGNYTFTGGGTGNVGNIIVATGANVTFSAASGTLGTGGNVRTITVGSGSLLDFNANAISTAAGVGFIKSGAGVLALSGGTYAGGFTLNAGTVILRGVNAMGDGGLLTLNGGTVAGSATRNLTDKYDSGIVIGGDVQFGEVASNVSIALNTANLTFNNNVALGAATRAFTIGNNGTQTFSGVISGSAGTGLTIKANVGTTGSIVLSGTNTYTGLTDVQSGTLTLGNATNTIANTSNVTVSGGTLNVANSDTVGAVTLSSGLISGVGTLTGSSYSLTNTGTISAALGGSGNLTKTGAGTATLSGNNSLTGSTLVSAGTLLLSGNATMGSGNVTVNGGLDLSGITGSTYSLTNSQTLSGNGTITTTGKTLSVAGILNPGNSPGTLSVTGNLTLTSTAVSNFEITGTTAGLFDSLAVSGLLTLGGGTLNLSTTYGFAVNDFVDILNFGSVSGTFSTITGTDLGGGLSWDTSALYTTGVITVVPEPKTWALIALGSAFMLWNLRRKRSIKA